MAEVSDFNDLSLTVAGEAVAATAAEAAADGGGGVGREQPQHNIFTICDANGCG